MFYILIVVQYKNIGPNSEIFSKKLFYQQSYLSKLLHNREKVLRY